MERSTWLSASSVIVFGLLTILGFVSLTSYMILRLPGTTLDVVLTVVLSIIAILGMVAMLFVVYSIFGLHDRQQALGLPDGSVRALVAIMLVIVFAIFAGYYFDRLDEAARQGQADFAKQIITVMATLMTAVVSFYFASRTSQDAAAVRGNPPETTPVVTGIDPTSAPGGEPATIKIAGSNLGNVTGVQLVRGQDVLTSMIVAATAASIVSQFEIPPSTAKGKWDLVLESPQGATAVAHSVQIT